MKSYLGGWARPEESEEPKSTDAPVESYQGCEPNLDYWCKRDGKSYVFEMYNAIQIFNK